MGGNMMEKEHIDPSTKRFLYAVMFTATLGGLLFGYDTGVVNGALPYMAQPDQLNLTPALEGFVVSALLFGAAIGSVTGGHIADVFGRRKMIICLAAIFFFAALGCTLSPSVYVMIPCRFVLGLAVGGASVTVPVYLAEISPANKRGRMVTQNELMIVSGQFLAYVCNAILGVMFGNTGHVWRYMLFMATIPAIGLFFGMLRMPESPRWMVLKGSISDALVVLKKLRSGETEAIAELNSIQDNIVQEASVKQFGWKDLKRPWIRRILLIGIGVAIATRFTGVNTIMFYGTQILTNAGFGRQIALIANVANGLTSVLATLVGIWLLGKIGRRTMFLIGLGGTTTSLFCIAMTSMLFAGSPMLPFLVLSMTILFLAFMQACIGPVLWLIIAEIFPLQLRGLGMGVCIFFLWIVDFMIGSAFPVLLSTLGLSAAFFFFVVSGLIAMIFVKTCVPETKGKTLEEIEQYFRSLNPESEK
jgi:major inositol transporter-like SP family MFS transporter